MADIANLTIKVDTSAIAGLTELMDHITAFIRDNEITCAETIYQKDSVITNAYEFIEGICDIMGYHAWEDDNNG